MFWYSCFSLVWFTENYQLMTRIYTQLVWVFILYLSKVMHILMMIKIEIIPITFWQFITNINPQNSTNNLRILKCVIEGLHRSSWAVNKSNNGHEYRFSNSNKYKLKTEVYRNITSTSFITNRGLGVLLWNIKKQVAIFILTNFLKFLFLFTRDVLPLFLRIWHIVDNIIASVRFWCYYYRFWHWWKGWCTFQISFHWLGRWFHYIIIRDFLFGMMKNFT